MKMASALPRRSCCRKKTEPQRHPFVVAAAHDDAVQSLFALRHIPSLAHVRYFDMIVAVTKKRLFLLAILPLVAFAVTVGVLVLLPPNTRPGVTKRNFDRIEKGMTKAEVEEIFGKKADGVGLTLDREQKEKTHRIWEASDGSGADIHFVDDCVVETDWYDSDETLLAKLRRWLHLR